MSIRIVCINKAAGHHEDPHVAISNLGWINEQTGERGKSSRQQVYDWLVAGGVASVVDGLGNSAYVMPRISHWGNPFVQTHVDTVVTDNLLYLPECT